MLEQEPPRPEKNEKPKNEKFKVGPYKGLLVKDVKGRLKRKRIAKFKEGIGKVKEMREFYGRSRIDTPEHDEVNTLHDDLYDLINGMRKRGEITVDEFKVLNGRLEMAANPSDIEGMSKKEFINDLNEAIERLAKAPKLRLDRDKNAIELDILSDLFKKWVDYTSDAWLLEIITEKEKKEYEKDLEDAYFGQQTP